MDNCQYSVQRHHTHCALNISEVLAEVFRYNNEPANACCARVCRGWTELALDELWRDLEHEYRNTHLRSDIRWLLHILSPLAQGDNGKLVFTEEIRPKSWARFEYYAKRVKSIHFEAIHDSGLDDSVFAEISVFRTAHRLLPNLKAISLHLYHCAYTNPHLPKFTLQFLHDGVRTLKLTLPTGQPADPEPPHPDQQEIVVSVPRLLEEIAARAPNLESVSFDFDYRVRVIEAELVLFFQVLRNLVRITLPRCTLSPKLLSAIGLHKHLRTVTYDNEDEEWPIAEGAYEDVSGVFQIPTDRTYLRLDKLQMHGILSNIQPFFADATGGSLSALTNITVGIILEEREGYLRNFLRSLARSCPSLETLHLTLDTDSAMRNLGPEGNAVTAMTLSPLRDFPSLYDLALDCNRPVALSDEEFVELVTSCPSLTHLCLAHEPHVLDIPRLTIYVLHRLALQGSRIKHLSIYANAAIAQFQMLPIDSGLENLRSICFGYSPMSNAEKTAIYLSQFLPFDIKIPLFTRHDEFNLHDDEGRVRMRKSRKRRWEDVHRLIRFAEQIRVRHLREINELEERVELMADVMLKLSQSAVQTQKAHLRKIDDLGEQLEYMRRRFSASSEEILKTSTDSGESDLTDLEESTTADSDSGATPDAK